MTSATESRTTERVDLPPRVREAIDELMRKKDVTDNRTTELLRKLLEERGVSCQTNYLHASWRVGPKLYDAVDNFDGTLTVDNLTPEQAIAATLGSEQELIDLAHNAWSMALCAMQGMPIPADWGNAVERGLRKYGIDVDEELAGFEVIDE
ncbi:MAG: hypothetical protein IIZ12_01735 [Eggerthellaceae bacterium]|nr:hypothetical protein [Eggerthellaceae bacterium]